MATPPQTPSPRSATPEENEIEIETENNETPSPLPLTNEIDLPEESEANTCQICNEKYRQPRVLSCLHVFCTPCLEKRLEEAAAEQEGEETESQTPPSSLTCPECGQETKLPEKGITDLQQDFVLISMLDLDRGQDMQIVCTSCKAREKAVARCTDCANFLCPNCVTAHQFMRCFENHKVVSFEDLQNGELHKPMFCSIHPTENMKFYCNTCQVPVCSECVAGDHKEPEHQHDRIADIESKQVEELRGLITESQGKVKLCQEAVTTLENAQLELQLQRDNARGLLQETFQTYKAILDKRQEELLNELSEIHSTQRSAIWDTAHSVEKTIEKIEDSCTFAERVLKNGSGVEILALKKLISDQLLSLINNTPKTDVDTKIEFVSDEEKFREAVLVTSHMKKHGTEVEQEVEQEDLKDESVASIPSIDNEGLAALPLGIISPEPPGILTPVTAPEFIPTMPNLPPLSIPNIPPLTGAVSSITTDPISSIAAIPNLPSERSSSRNSYSPAMSDSGISVDAASTSSCSNQPQLTMAALQKLGQVSVNSQGQITVNGQVIQGLNVNQLSGPPSTPLTPRVHTPTQQSSDGSIANLLNAASMSGPATPTTPGLGQLGDLATLLNQAGNQLNGLGTISSSTSPSGILGQPLRGVGAGLSMNGSMNLPTPPPPQTPTYHPGGAHPPFPNRSGKVAPMQIRCKFGQLGPGKGQFNSPHGFCLGLEEDIVVADTNNHRIQVFEKTGEFKFQFGIPGREEGQLWYPRKVAVIRHSGKYVVCDRGNERSRMQIFTKSGHFIKKIAIRYIDIVAGLAITTQGHIVAVDSVSPTVFCIAETGDLIKWFDCSDYMREPSDIAISGKEYFVCDFKGHCVVVFNEEGQFMRRIGCENITNFPNGIDISDAGDVLVGDSHGNRFHVAVFQREGSLIGEFECPYVKVSRCCGLKITSEGYIVTLAKNNHHVLVLNTLYIT